MNINLIKRTEEEEEENKQNAYRDLFPEIKKGIFNPIMNSKHQVLLYLSFKYKSVKKVYVYDFLSPITIPNDIM